METRPATNEEIFHYFRHIQRVQYRHFVREIYNPRSKNGISHRQYSRSKLHNIDGVPHVRYQGELTPIVAIHFTLDTDLTFVCRVRIDNPYLPVREG